MSNFEQLFGLEAIGAVVARDFGELGTFTGRVIKFVRGKGKGKDLYTVEYEDGDVEDMDTEEYNFAYAHHLRREGWDLEEDLEVNSEASGDFEEQSKNWRPSKVTCNSTFIFVIFVERFSMHFSTLTLEFIQTFLSQSVRGISKQAQTMRNAIMERKNKGKRSKTRRWVCLRTQDFCILRIQTL